MTLHERILQDIKKVSDPQSYGLAVFEFDRLLKDGIIKSQKDNSDLGLTDLFDFDEAVKNSPYNIDPNFWVYFYKTIKQQKAGL